MIVIINVTILKAKGVLGKTGTYREGGGRTQVNSLHCQWCAEAILSLLLSTDR